MVLCKVVHRCRSSKRCALKKSNSGAFAIALSIVVGAMFLPESTAHHPMKKMMHHMMMQMMKGSVKKHILGIKSVFIPIPIPMPLKLPSIQFSKGKGDDGGGNEEGGGENVKIKYVPIPVPTKESTGWPRQAEGWTDASGWSKSATNQEYDAQTGYAGSGNAEVAESDITWPDKDSLREWYEKQAGNSGWNEKTSESRERKSSSPKKDWKKKGGRTFRKRKRGENWEMMESDWPGGSNGDGVDWDDW